jgi:hypothetical protein
MSLNVYGLTVLKILDYKQPEAFALITTMAYNGWINAMCSLSTCVNSL